MKKIKKTILFATGNKHKFAEAKKILSKIGIKISKADAKHNEMRSNSLEEIAANAVASAYKKLNAPVFVEDSGLFIIALNGFPGTYSAWAHEKIGRNGMLKLLKGEKNRKARFSACIAFHDGQRIVLFSASCKGTIALGEKGKGGFGYDSIFLPKGYKRTFAQSKELKNELSHRYKALTKLANYIAD